MSLLKRNLKALSAFLSRDGMRPILGSIHLTDTAAEATDSYKLARITRNATEDLGDFPTVGGKRPITEPLDICLEGDSVMRAVAGIPGNRRGTLPILARAAIIEDSDHYVSIATTDLTSSTITIVRKVEGTFPPCEQLLAEAKAGETYISFNAGFLKQLAAAYVTFGAKWVTIRIATPLKPAYFTAKNDSGERMEAILMPVRDGEAA